MVNVYLRTRRPPAARSRLSHQDDQLRWRREVVRQKAPRVRIRFQVLCRQPPARDRDSSGVPADDPDGTLWGDIDSVNSCRDQFLATTRFQFSDWERETDN